MAGAQAAEQGGERDGCERGAPEHAVGDHQAAPVESVKRPARSQPSYGNRSGVQDNQDRAGWRELPSATSATQLAESPAADTTTWSVRTLSSIGTIRFCQRPTGHRLPTRPSPSATAPARTAATEASSTDTTEWWSRS